VTTSAGETLRTTPGLGWQVALLSERRPETATARTLVFEVPGWRGHRPGQHVDVRLTAADGYSAQRSYSLAAPVDLGHPERIELTVQAVIDGEVSPFLVDHLAVGDPVEIRGPVGGWFVWTPEVARPVLLVAGGSGVVPLMSMIRGRSAAGSRRPFRLVYSVRGPDDVLYAAELRTRVRDDVGLDVAVLYTRLAPRGERRPAGRISAADLSAHRWPAEFGPRTYVCGPTPFVETVADLLVAAGHDPGAIRAERYGSSGADR
jgi:ferredoxin-NADP reductase